MLQRILNGVHGKEEIADSAAEMMATQAGFQQNMPKM